MADSSTFREVIGFFGDLGIFDVLLPFLLVFTIVFAILEKSRVFGTEEIDGKKYTRKNLNAMTAFVIGFLVIASSRLVETITQVSSQIVVLLMLGVFFLLLIGPFHKESPEGVFLSKPWNIIFMVIMFIGILGIFLNAIKTKSGSTWLETGWNFLVEHWSSKIVSSIVLLIIIIIFMWFVTGDKRKVAEPKKEGS